jgi:hypothetical protein
MTPKSSNTSGSTMLRITLLILGMAVFVWGLQYKLSLYDTPYHPNPVRMAKLIQGDQPGKKIAATQLQNRCSELHLALYRSAVAVAAPVLIRPYRTMEEPLLASPPPVSSPQSVRPPPQFS